MYFLMYIYFVSIKLLNFDASVIRNVSLTQLQLCFILINTIMFLPLLLLSVSVSFCYVLFMIKFLYLSVVVSLMLCVNQTMNIIKDEYIQFNFNVVPSIYPNYETK